MKERSENEKQEDQMIRQGDVLLVRVATVEDGRDVAENGRLVLAHGEVTGHAHTVVMDRPQTDTGKLIESVHGRRYLCLSGPATLTHQEHGSIALAPGDYRVIRQMEWTDENEPRQVAD